MAEKSQFDPISSSLSAIKVARWTALFALAFLGLLFAVEALLNAPFINPVPLESLAAIRFVKASTEPVINALGSVVVLKKVDSTGKVVYDLTSFAPLLIAAAVYILMVLVKNQSLRLVVWLDAKRQVRQVQVAKPKAQSADGLSFSSTSTDKDGRGLLGRIGMRKEDERDKLLRELADVKKRLEATKQRLAFLSVDIVGSTRMKVGLDPLVSEHLFREYRLLLEGIFKKFRYRAASWTPDGVMACFPQVDLAFGSAKELLNKLPAFNKEKNRAGIAVRVRCGLNAGEVHYDESTPLELLSSRVLDITGHLQKAALPDTILVTEEIYQEIREKSGLISGNEDVDGHRVYQWGSGTTAVAQTGGTAN